MVIKKYELNKAPSDNAALYIACTHSETVRMCSGSPLKKLKFCSFRQKTDTDDCQKAQRLADQMNETMPCPVCGTVWCFRVMSELELEMRESYCQGLQERLLLGH